VLSAGEEALKFVLSMRAKSYPLQSKKATLYDHVSLDSQYNLALIIDVEQTHPVIIACTFTIARLNVVLLSKNALKPIVTPTIRK
jgi:hypothetical protein